MKIIINCENLTGRKQAHEYLAQIFNFPEYYGKNLDALADCLSEISDCTVVFEGKEALIESGGYGVRIIKVIEAAAASNPGLEIALESAAESEIVE